MNWNDEEELAAERERLARDEVFDLQAEEVDDDTEPRGE